MFLSSIYKCDVCGKEEISDGCPKEWFEIEIVRGDYAIRENLLLDQQACSQECINKLLLAYLNKQNIYTSHT